MNFRADELAFERAARDYYLAQTGKRDWSEIKPELRAYYRQKLADAANEVDAWISRQVTENEGAANYLRAQGFLLDWDAGMLLYRVKGFPNLTKLTEAQLIQVARQHGWAG